MGKAMNKIISNIIFSFCLKQFHKITVTKLTLFVDSWKIMIIHGAGQRKNRRSK